jgi:adenine-specific DNA-methyltransferase
MTTPVVRRQMMHFLSDWVNRVICGDCVQVMGEMPDQSVDLVVTDPPYAARYRDRSGRTVANDDNTSWLIPAFRHVARVLKDDRLCVSFYGWHQAEKFLAAWKSVGLRPVGHFVWVKTYPSNRAARYAQYHHESAYLLAKGNPRPPHAIADVLEWDYSGNRHHPTQKPVSAMTPLIEAYSGPGDIVLDPFAGSGTTAVAAKKMDRRYIAIELDARYCETARERLRRV